MQGLLVPLSKPNKPKGPVKNLRSITLLEVIRKVLSKIEVERTEKALNQYLSKSQSAYRKYRSTTDIIWAFRLILAKVQEQEIVVHVIGIDMSSAFDTIHRDKIIEIGSKIFDEDEVRILRVLLSDTTLEIKIKGAQTTLFKSNIGSPQGDGISGSIFTMYFEHNLQELRKEIRQQLIYAPDRNKKWIEQRNSCLPTEMIYADDYGCI